MKQFIEKYRDQVTGVLSGFDRLVFRGSLRRLSQNSILMKDFGTTSSRSANGSSGRPLKPYDREQVVFLRSAAVDKEAVARKVASERDIKGGWVCAISALEPSPTFEHRRTHIIRRERPSNPDRPGDGVDARAHSDVVSI
jgi:hypothetical protein